MQKFSGKPCKFFSKMYLIPGYTEMKMKNFFLRILPVILVLAVVAGVLFWRQEKPEFRRTFPVMGTVAQITLYAPDKEANAAYDAIRAEFDKVLKIANLYNPESELSRLNKTAFDKPFVCSKELWQILSASREAYRITGGAFDISAKPLMMLWGFYRKNHPGKIPTALERFEAMKKTGLNNVIFDDAARSVRFTVPGMALDLGGLAKGYAVDRAAEAMKKAGIASGVIDLGGNLFLGEPPQGKDFFSIGIKDAGNKGKLGNTVLKLKNCAVSTSGDYERFVVIDGRKYGHIMDPATGLPCHQEFSATVTAPTALQADYLSTAFYLRPQLNTGLRDIQVVFQSSSNKGVKMDMEKLDVNKIKRGIVCFTFDDGRYQEWLANMELFKRCNAKATFFYSGEITREAAISMQILRSEGHSVGLHTVNHKNAVNDGVDADMEEYFKSQVLPQLEAAARYGVKDLRYFAYPNNRHSAGTDQFLGKYFARFRVGSKIGKPAGFRIADEDKAYIAPDKISGRKALGGCGIGEYYKSTEKNLDAALTRAAERNELIVFFSHGIFPDADGVHMPTALLEHLLKKCAELQLTVAGFDELPE